MSQGGLHFLAEVPYLRWYQQSESVESSDGLGVVGGVGDAERRDERGVEREDERDRISLCSSFSSRETSSLSCSSSATGAGGA